MTAQFKVGDKVRAVRNSAFNTIVRGATYTVTAVNSEGNPSVAGGLVIIKSSWPKSLFELAEPAPLPFRDVAKRTSAPEAPLQLAVGDRVELAGVQGEVKDSWNFPFSAGLEVLWDGVPAGDGGNYDVIDAKSPLFAQLKKVEPAVEEPVYVTGGWYKRKSLNNSLFHLTQRGWEQIVVDDCLGSRVYGPDSLPVNECSDLVEVELPF